MVTFSSHLHPGLLLLTGHTFVIECLAQIGQAPQEQGTSQHSKFRQVFSLKAVHLLAFFILVYVGVEARKIKNFLTCMLTNVHQNRLRSGAGSSLTLSTFAAEVHRLDIFLQVSLVVRYFATVMFIAYSLTYRLDDGACCPSMDQPEGKQPE